MCFVFFLDAEKINYSPYFIQRNFWFHRQRCILTSDVLAVKKVEPFFKLEIMMNIKHFDRICEKNHI